MNVISPAELVADIINRLGVPGEIPAGAVVGPANHDQQQAGVASIMAGGLPTIEKYTPLQWHRTQIRCLAPTLAEADRISQAVFRQIGGDSPVRLVAYQASTGDRYLVHLINVTAGPSMHYDSIETYETLLFAELMIGSDPVQSL